MKVLKQKKGGWYWCPLPCCRPSDLLFRVGHFWPLPEQIHYPSQVVDKEIQFILCHLSD